MQRKKKRKAKSILALGVILFMISGVTALYIVYHFAFKPNLHISEPTYFYIPTGSSFEEVKAALVSEGLIKRSATFSWLAKKKNYPARVLPGRYLLNKHMGNNSLINLLRSGEQEPLNLTFNNIRTKQQLAGVISARLEADSLSLLEIMQDASIMEAYGHTPETAMLLFIPNTYEFFWNTSARQVLDRMHREYHRFWNASRLEKAEHARLHPKEIMILASIVQRETNRSDEMARIAGVYINRIRNNMPLQADPTVVYAWGDFTITRVLHHHLQIDSPYNTYKYRGLPPGPIGLPEPGAIDMVLDFENHQYLYFCARDDFSGYHAFARTYNEHLANARRYHRALNQRRIME